ncbi:ATP-binding protein [Polaribacter litorisediminis]|uniref:ATP-binding protein n=1 Tax=Polaribacter litorisediminis TaxID=1908341 RepID=UPI001CBDF5C9|nr:ATP-binding protein [Polaribacter litorisediminis]UAM98380.1 ATP-binding protein [Polaribacter litorisediminis]
MSEIEDVNLLTVDFNNIRFLETDDFVVLACLIESFYAQGSQVAFEGGSTSLNNHLFNIKFKEYWKEGFNRENFTLSKNHTTLCLWKISQQMIYTYTNYAKEYFERFTDNKDLIPLASNIDEVFNNIFDHSKSPVSGYIITQYYPKNNKIIFSVCDFGVGIACSINNDLVKKQEKPIEDWKAIIKSLERGYSIKSTPRNRGFGLNNILELTESSNGKLQILSNTGIVEKRSGEMYRAGDFNFNFPGTLIKVEVDLNTFEEKDDTEDIYEF